jgi:Asp-tRNA(Asn)/Glu-tRNA(Gln) amidotransferase A subunit family amidase
MGLSKNGLPLSFQIAGRPNDEAITLRVGAAIERELASIF